MAPPVLAPCSYLYSLPSIGVGTAAVESFTGYVTRLAAAHAVETGVLVNTELLPRVPCTKGASIGGIPSKMPTAFFIDAFPLNGIGERARAWVSVLERMTGVRGLDLLTLLPWSKTISCIHLLRTHRAWCPYCYGKQPGLADQHVYDRLLWTFQVVTACPVHGCPLESICPSCTKEQYVFAPRMRPGYCARCQAWLGRAPQCSINDRSESVRIAEMIGELLAASPHLPSRFGLDRFGENMRTFRRCRQVHSIIERGNIRGWMKGNAPRMDSLVLLSLHQNTSMLNLLTEPIVIEPRVTSHPAHAHYRVDGSTLEAALRGACREDMPPSLTEIATRLGYLSVTPLQFRFHDLCQAIIRKRRAHLKLSSAPVTVPIPRERIEQALSEALLKDRPISLSSLAKSIGLRNKRRLYKGFHDLRKAVIANNRQHRRQRGAAIESALHAGLAEIPVPFLTDIARRLGLKSTSALTRRFFDLSTELKRRRQAELDNGQLRSRTSRTANLSMIATVSRL
ncbi:MAG: TniQ family protein [Terracidiphilus sp.]